MATVDKHTVIIIILVVLLLGSLAFSLFVMLDETKEERVIGASDRMTEKGTLLEEAGKKGGPVAGSISESSEDDALARVQAEMQRVEAEKAALEQEKKAWKEKTSALEKQLIEETKSRPLFNVDKESPFDHVKDNQVRVLQNKVEIDLKEVTWWEIKDTNSMDPVIDIGTTALSVKPRSEEALHEGDVALYDSLIAKTVIIHRIITIAADQEGWYSKFKGDNLEQPDPENVRFLQIKGVLIGVIY